jgi:hypothetical protein
LGRSAHRSGGILCYIRTRTKMPKRGAGCFYPLNSHKGGSPYSEGRVVSSDHYRQRRARRHKKSRKPTAPAHYRTLSNLSLNQEIYFIEKFNDCVRDGHLSGPKHEVIEVKWIRMLRDSGRRIEADSPTSDVLEACYASTVLTKWRATHIPGSPDSSGIGGSSCEPERRVL